MRAALLLLCLTALAATARATTAVCGVDLERELFSWVLPDGEALAPLEVPGARARLARLDSLLAAADPADTLRRALGQEILGPHLARIAAAGHWRFVPEAVQDLPGTLGGLAVLEIPDGRGDPALLRHRISLGWPRPLRPPAASAAAGEGALLLSAPFAADVDPALDDPDTLRAALRRVVRTVRMVPRNETGADALRQALEEARPGLWWFRGDDVQLARLNPAGAILPPVVVWTLPSRSSQAAPALLPATLAGTAGTPACIVVSTRALPETTLAALARDFVDGLARGLDCGRALHAAQRRALDDGAPLALAAGLVAIGDPDTVAGLARASWLRRHFGSL